MRNFFLSLLLLLTGVVFAADSLSFKQTETSVALIKENQVVWQFNFASDQTKPYFHPLSLSDGTVLTWVSPPDHRWHYGLWFSWKFINGVNYWEEDPKTRKPAGITSWENVQVNTHQDHSATINLDLSYHEPGKPTLLTEKRTIAISTSTPS